MFYAHEPMRGVNDRESRLHEDSCHRFSRFQMHSDIRIQRVARTIVAEHTRFRSAAVKG